MHGVRLVPVVHANVTCADKYVIEWSDDALQAHLVEGSAEVADDIKISVRGVAKTASGDPDRNRGHMFVRIDPDDALLGFLGNVEIIVGAAKKINGGV